LPEEGAEKLGENAYPRLNSHISATAWVNPPNVTT